MDERKFGTYLERAIETRSPEDIRGALKGIIDADPAFLTGRYDNAVAHLVSLGLDVYEPHDPGFSLRENRWDKGYFSLVMTHLTYNFSAERVAHLRAVGAEVMADDPVYHTAPTGAEQETKSPEIPKSQANTGKSRRVPAVPVLAAAVILLAVLLLRILLN